MNAPTLTAQKILIRPNQSWLRLDWAGLWQYRDLLVLLVQRDFTSRYQQTILGPIWFIINPLINAVVFTVLFSRIIGIPTDGVPPMLFYLGGQLAWNYFANVLGTTGNSLAGNASIFSKVYFPRLIPPLAMCGSSLIAFAVQFAVFAAFWLYHVLATPFGASLHIDWKLALLPLLIVQTAALGLGMGLVLSAITAKYRDLQQLTGYLLQIGMYATPVIYPLSRIPEEWRWLAGLNPMASIVELTRVILLGVGSVTLVSHAISLLLTAAVLLGGIVLYQRTARTFVDTV
ncbi:ABC transporter permease [Oleiharenicola lentus]|uniref:ABC transporter permease n=1 Tax=Oleiharenicola lentus TaxID=2508720 RepID=UPI003F67DBD2